MNFTPGPWKMVCDIGVGVKVHRDGMIPNGARYAIAQLGIGRGDSEDEANASLIAAAPDLLAALQGILDNFKANQGNGVGIGPISKARAAIARATGK